MFKKLLLVSFFIFSTVFAYGQSVEKYQKTNEVEIQKSISDLNKQNKSIAVIAADIFSADAFLQAMPNAKKGKVNELFLLLPDAKLFKNNIAAVSTKVKNVYVIFSNSPLTEKYLENRSYPEYLNIGAIEPIDNVKIYTLPIDRGLESHIVKDSMNKNVLDTDLYKLVEKSGLYIIQE
ncbi:hypothetical protein IX317_000978 [Fusobacterium sp. DD29]|uniref:hypothetical protein n=1 Tax=unclassified Fusobacterium TaxID=2648384 RepID=UPI001B8BE173|nr:MULTISPECIES: hypothetical protein [unclassified Fusobacterium]MBR8700930.1 hypothetical protein [Fusobacterium sp. DD45]MBR8710710.1 hypothetical protein [Fusobacterium sp. DD28]MBR8749313.1 hypothetical protein [Fusobacterium sp. DD29]MBR8751296.1 hypothetical protein [Fusobacterium sp. DD26]MBR8761589.1 hypothetical protein [Fusobacterium sp. DD25]